MKIVLIAIGHSLLNGRPEKGRASRIPITNEVVGGHSAICCHLLNQVYFHGQKIKWEPKKMEFAGGTGNAQWLTRDYRAPWTV